MRAGFAHGAGYWIENPVRRGPGLHAIAGHERHASMWDHPETKAFLRETGAVQIIIDQCMLLPADDQNNARAQKTTVFACDAVLGARLQQQLAHLKCDGTHFHDAVMQPRRADG